MSIHDFLWGGSDKDKYSESFYDIENKDSMSDYVKAQQKLAQEVKAKKQDFRVVESASSVPSTSAFVHPLPSLNSLREPVNRVIPVEDIERLRLACQAMWELLRDKHGFTDDDIEEKIQEIDLRDGVDDNQMTVTMVTCPSCDKKSRSYRPVCLYCGAEIPKPEIFSK